MPDAQVIGKVSVKVIPDTSDFRKDVKRALDKIEASLPKLKIELKVDDNRLKAEVLRAVRDVNNSIKDNDLYKIKLRTKIDANGMKGEIRSAVRELNTLAKNERVNFKASVSAAMAELKLDEDSMRHVRKQIEDFRDRLSPVKVLIKPEVANGAPAAVAARLAVLTRPRDVDIIPKLDNKAAAGVVTALAALSGARVLNDMLDGLWGRLKRLDQSVPIIGTLAEAIAGLSAAGLAGVGTLFTLATSLAQIGPAALALPGIFGGIGLGVGVMVAAIKDFNTVIPEMADMMHSLQDTISNNFWAKAEQPIRRMIDTLFPLFRSNMAQTATELGNFFGKFADSLAGTFKPILGSMFDDLHESIKIASRYTDDFTNIIGVLGRVGAGYLPQLARYFGDIARSFSDWLTRVDASGELKRWIDQGIFQLKELGRALGNVGGIFKGLADIAKAAGGSTLTMFADTLGAIEKTVKSAGFIEQLTWVLKGAYAAMDTITTASGPALKGLFSTLAEVARRNFPVVADAIGTLIKGFAEARSQFAIVQGFGKLFYGLAQAAHALAPAMAPLGQALGAMLGIVGELAKVIGPVVAVALATLAKILVELAPVITQIIQLLGDGLLKILQAIAPQLVELGKAIADAFVELLPQIIPLIQAMIQLAIDVLPKVIEGLIEVIPAAVDFVQTLVDLFNAIAPLLPAITAVAGALIGVFLNALSAVGQFLGGFAQVITGYVNFWKSAFTLNVTGMWNAVKQIFSGYLNMIGGIVKIAFGLFYGTIQGAFGQIKSAVSSAWNSVVTFTSTALKLAYAVVATKVEEIKSRAKAGFDSLKGAVSDAMGRAKTAVADGFARMVAATAQGLQSVVAKCRALPGQIAGALAGIAGVTIGIGQNIVSGMISGIGSMASTLASKAISVVTGAINAAKGALGIHSPSRVFMEIGRYTGEGLVIGIDREAASVARAFESMVATPDVNVPAVKSASPASAAGTAVGSSLDPSGSNRQFIYHAAAGSSLGSEEDLFEAANRGRMVGW